MDFHLILQIAEDKLYDHWQQNNPDIRKVGEMSCSDFKMALLSTAF